MLILYGIHNGVEKPQSLVKLYEVKQGDRESPLAFCEWLCEVAQTWTWRVKVIGCCSIFP